ncbi:HlyD family secretion protein [Paenibacillus algorifonticola]|uniref:HlyD family secretion protein n=1 Tax=Paenibacillus algorifonticola TaxID=684063 RepID=A0A1I2IDR4_9BACL|nr:efflux RND transporter periplasmic adaptor subunit [Paenibacillus algorifonticola]SFF38976.1 HlyD family secretion protein [Paenibacillus algorifonticola]
MKKWKLWLGIILVVGAAGGGGAYYYLKMGQPATVQAATSQTVKATRGNIELKISATGSVEANSRETVTSGVSGTIAKLNFKVGDKVKAGQVLATFESEKDYDSQIEQTELSIKKQQVQMEQYQTKYKEAAGTEDELTTQQSIKTDMEMLALEIKQNQDSLSTMREDQLKVTEVVATIDGEVTESEVSVGDEVVANTVIASIVNYDLLDFVVQVDELDIPSVKAGQVVQVYLSALTDKTIEGKVASLAREGTASNGVSAYEVTISLDTIEGVITGMSGEADIILESKNDVVVVPVDAVIERGGKSFVRVPTSTQGTTGSQGTSGAAGAQGAAGASGAQGMDGAAGAQGNAGASGAQGTDGAAGGQGAGGAAQGAAGAQGAVGTQGASSTQGASGTQGQGGTGTQGGRSAQAETGGQGAGGTAQGAAGTQGASGTQGTRGTQGTSGAAQGTTSAQGMNGTAQGAAGAQGTSGMQRTGGAQMEGQLVEVEAGISDETYVEIISGLNEGDSVLIPTPQGTVGMTTTTTQQNQATMGGMMPGGFGGGTGGGFGGGGGGFTGGGAGGGRP